LFYYSEQLFNGLRTL